MDEPINYFDIDSLMERPLSQDEVLLKNEFVDEYLLDFNAFSAALRLGFLKELAEDVAKDMMLCSYVNQRIQYQLQNTKRQDENIDAEKLEIINMLRREANYHGVGAQHGARVNAIKALGAIYGMEAPKKKEVSIVDKSGVMQVPEMTDPNSWTKLAEESQSKLKDEVRH